jgi:phage-related protein
VSKRIEVRFYRQESGREPVRDWLLDLDREDRRIIGEDIKTVEFGWPIGMPTCRPLSDGLWEARSNISHGRIARVIFTISGSKMILLTGFIKKAQRTPADELRIARQRMKDVTSHDS